MAMWPSAVARWVLPTPTGPRMRTPVPASVVERGHRHTQATVAVARKLVERTWTVLTRGQPYQFRDATGQAVTRTVAKDQARHDHAVPDDVRARARARSAATHRSKLTK